MNKSPFFPMRPPALQRGRRHAVRRGCFPLPGPGAKRNRENDHGFVRRCRYACLLLHSRDQATVDGAVVSAPTKLAPIEMRRGAAVRIRSWRARLSLSDARGTKRSPCGGPEASTRKGGVTTVFADAEDCPVDEKDPVLKEPRRTCGNGKPMIGRLRHALHRINTIEGRQGLNRCV